MRTRSIVAASALAALVGAILAAWATAPIWMPLMASGPYIAVPT